MPLPERLLVVVATDAERPEGFSGEVLVTGVGKTAAAASTARRLAAGGVDAVVSFGAAGAYPAGGLAVGDVAVATEVAILDEGLSGPRGFQSFRRRGFPVPGTTWRPTDAGLRERMVSAETLFFRVVPGRIATVSVCAGTGPLARQRGAEGAIAEGMEGAAVLHATFSRVPFAEVRGISNPCGEREGAPFDLETAVANASRVLRRLVAEARRR